MKAVAVMAEATGRIGGSQGSGVPAWRWIGYALTVLVPVIIWFAPLNFDPTAKHALAISSLVSDSLH